MSDPHSELDVFIRDILTLQNKNHNNNYRFAPAQALKTAADKYHENPTKESFVQLINAISRILPYISNTRVINLSHFKNKVDEIASKQYQMTSINWQSTSHKTRSTARMTVGFQFTSVSSSGNSLIAWLNNLIKRDFAQLTTDQQTQILIESYIKYDGFSTVLKKHLIEQPEFLVNLTLDSETNFMKIAQSRLSLFLDDQQMAKIMRSHWLNEDKEYDFDTMDQILYKMASVLTYGRTIGKLLENSNVQEYLKDTEFLNVYQSDRYQRHLEEAPLGINLSPNR